MSPSAPVSPRPHRVTATLLAALVALFVFAFVARPYGCAWGTDAYGYAGLGVIALGVGLPWLRRDRTWLERLQLTVAWGFAAFAVTVAGLFAADLPLFCP
jgi:hypothetical protein